MTTTSSNSLKDGDRITFSPREGGEEQTYEFRNGLFVLVEDEIVKESVPLNPRNLTAPSALGATYGEVADGKNEFVAGYYSPYPAFVTAEDFFDEPEETEEEKLTPDSPLTMTGASARLVDTAALTHISVRREGEHIVLRFYSDVEREQFGFRVNLPYTEGPNIAAALNVLADSEDDQRFSGKTRRAENLTPDIELMTALGDRY
jgi:hypothetical protein